MSSFGERLREERERLGLNQTDFGELGGVSKRAQINYEQNSRSPDAAYLSAVAGAGVDVLYILTGQRATGTAATLAPDEAALLDNYRHSPKSEREILKATSAAFAQSACTKQASGQVKNKK